MLEEDIKGYNLSADLYKKSKALGMADIRYYIYASLRGSGLSIKNSWNVAFQGKGANWPKDTLEREMNKLESLESVQKRIAEVQGKKIENEHGEDLSPAQLAKATSKEQILKDLVIARSKLKSTSCKEWADYTKMIGDFTKIKQDDLQTEDTTCHFYLPVNYPTGKNDCILFKNGLCKGGK